MECRDVQMIVLTTEKGGLSPEVQRHLKNCPACRDFAESHRRIVDAYVSCEPGIELDRKVRRAARLKLRSLRAARDTDRSRAFIIIRRCLAAAAAVAILIALGRRFAVFPSDQPGENGVVEITSRESQHSASEGWEDFDLEAGLLSLEVALLESGAFESPVAGEEVPGEHSVSERGTGGSLDEILMELELSLCFEHAGLDSDRS